MSHRELNSKIHRHAGTIIKEITYNKLELMELWLMTKLASEEYKHPNLNSSHLYEINTYNVRLHQQYQPYTLSTYNLSGLGIQQKLRIFTQIVAAIQYLHRNGIMHLDIKPDNILLSNTKDNITAILADYGACTLKCSPVTFNMTTNMAAPPEAFTNNYVSEYSTDLYSLGKVLEYMNIRHTATGYLDAIKGLLETDKDRRWTLQQLIDSVLLKEYTSYLQINDTIPDIDIKPQPIGTVYHNHWLAVIIGYMIDIGSARGAKISIHAFFSTIDLIYRCLPLIFPDENISNCRKADLQVFGIACLYIATNLHNASCRYESMLNLSTGMFVKEADKIRFASMLNEILRHINNNIVSTSFYTYTNNYELLKTCFYLMFNVDAYINATNDQAAYIQSLSNNIDEKGQVNSPLFSDFLVYLNYKELKNNPKYAIDLYKKANSQA